MLLRCVLFGWFSNELINHARRAWVWPAPQSGADTYGRPRWPLLVARSGPAGVPLADLEKAVNRTKNGSDAGDHRYGMQPLLPVAQSRIDDPIPGATTVALMISRAGAEGLTLDELRRKTLLPFDVLDRLLRRLFAPGQVFLSRVDGRLVYRAGI